MRVRQGRVGGAEDSHPLIDEADVAQLVAVADVVIAEDEEPPARAAPEGAHRRRLRLRMQHVAHADDEVLVLDPAAPGLQQVVVHLRRGRERALPQPRAGPGRRGAGRTRSRPSPPARRRSGWRPRVAAAPGGRRRPRRARPADPPARGRPPTGRGSPRGPKSSGPIQAGSGGAGVWVAPRPINGIPVTVGRGWRS